MFLVGWIINSYLPKMQVEIQSDKPEDIEREMLNDHPTPSKTPRKSKDEKERCTIKTKIRFDISRR
jgi:hypothetical protein